jgi:glycosyltransferase involved in cell wall biosynthesis
MISVVILTKNEERDLPGCLESVRFSDDVQV